MMRSRAYVVALGCVATLVVMVMGTGSLVRAAGSSHNTIDGLDATIVATAGDTILAAVDCAQDSTNVVNLFSSLWVRVIITADCDTATVIAQGRYSGKAAWTTKDTLATSSVWAEGKVLYDSLYINERRIPEAPYPLMRFILVSREFGNQTTFQGIQNANVHIIKGD